MARAQKLLVVVMCLLLLFVAAQGVIFAQDAKLPAGVKAVWDMSKAHRETTPTRERICINGLWRWQPSTVEADGDRVPTDNWGWFKVPGSWPGTTNWMQKDSQTVFAHPSWKDTKLRGIKAAWYQREIAIPENWAGRRITLCTKYVNSYAAVYLDGKKIGEILFPAGEVDITSACRPGGKHVLSLYTTAMPLSAVVLAYNDTSAPRLVKGSVARRGLCGDVFLVSTPKAARIGDVKVNTSVRKWEITFDAALDNLQADKKYRLRAQVTENGGKVKTFTSEPFAAADLKKGRIASTNKWKADKLWDIHTPKNMYHVQVSLIDSANKALDVFRPVRFGFREFWIEGRDFYLNGTRLYLSAVPLDNAHIGAALSNYKAALESLKRLKSFGINYVYTHNYSCKPGTHLTFTGILRAADDAGILVGLSQPHFRDYKWGAPDADETNGYAHHAEFYVRVAQNHPSVVFYHTSHNATGYADDMNPDMIDGIQIPRSRGSLRNAKSALRAGAIIKRLDPTRVTYHHSSGNLGPMHTSNFYTNWAPAQELDDWFEHWATKGAKPVFTCEYMVPCAWDWSMYRGWYKGKRAFGGGAVPWEFCLAEWNSQFFGDRAFRISNLEKKNLRWEAKQLRAGKLWKRWDYPTNLGSRDFKERNPVYAMYTTDNWRAFRTWGMSANSPWSYGHLWELRKDVDQGRKELKVDWENLQRPGLSPDYIEGRYKRMDLAFERSDWTLTIAGDALIRNNMPLLAYIGGKPAAFTSKDHNFNPGETVEKQLIVINNSRETVTAEGSWSLALPNALNGSRKVTIKTGNQERIPLRFALPADLKPGAYKLSATVKFSSGETQKDSFSINVMPRPATVKVRSKIALFDPKGETAKLLSRMGIKCDTVDANANLADYEMLIIGKGTLTSDGPAPNVARVRDGLKVIMFEQTSDVLEKRFGFRVQEYGLRWVFKRLPDHPLLAGLETENLRNWRGEATIMPSRLTYKRRVGHVPTVKWCDIPIKRVWRCGNRGNVASVLIEKPVRGDFLPIVDGGFSLQYSPLMEYREGKGMVLFCQMDVTGRTEADPAARQLAGNILNYVSSWKPTARRKVLYVGDAAGKAHLERAGLSPTEYNGAKLTAGDVLVVGPGGGKALAAHSAAIDKWLKAGGNLLAIGLDEQNANAFLPVKVGMKKAEHIAAYFEPADTGSLLAGVGPADVHCREPQQLPLISAGATIIGDGVLAKGENVNVVFCQLVPYLICKSQGALPSAVVDDKDAADGKKSALITMGSAGRGLLRQNIPAGEVGKTYTFAVFAKAVGGPASAHLEVERPATPWDRAVRGRAIPLNENEWTELHVTFKVEKPFKEGWAAYIESRQEGTRFRVDLFRLYEGEYDPKPQGVKIPFKNPSFETGLAPWRFIFRGEKHNIKQTYRRTAFLTNRLLANMGAGGSTPLLTRFDSPVNAAKAEKRWLDGFYLDTPEEWDDPYRFFRW